MTNCRRFEGKTALITGGASGFGRATLHRLVEEGLATAIVVDNDIDGSNREVEKVNRAGGKAIFIECDLSQADEIKRMGVEAAGRTDRVHVLVNNAGIGGSGSGFVEQDFLPFWDQMVDINLKACALVAQAVLPLLKVEGGSIVNISSDGGLRGRIGSFLYDATKAALISASKSMAVEFVKYGIRSNAIAPGWSATEFHFGMDKNPEQKKRELLELDSDTCLMRRLGRPEETAAAVAFLASDDSSYVTGTCLCVDGGRVGIDIPQK